MKNKLKESYPLTLKVLTNVTVVLQMFAEKFKIFTPV